MRALLEISLALLAVAGLVFIGWLCFGRLLAPAGGAGACTLIPAAGDGAELEQAVSGLLWLHSGGLLGGRMVIVDCGLTGEGRALASALCQREPELELCIPSEVFAYIDQGRSR